MTIRELRETLVGAYIFEVIRALDQVLNAMTGGFARETVSSRVGRLAPNSLLSKILSVVEEDHCRKAALREKPVTDFLLSKAS
jgi:hypothetical protein